MTKHYRKGIDYVAVGDTESAITAFIDGLDRGDKKCAYGIVEAAVLKGKSYTLGEDEAIYILQSNYKSLKHLAKMGDIEAMVMVAQSIRYGFVDDDEETLFVWLSRAKDKRSKRATEVLNEMEEDSDTLPDLDITSAASINEFNDALQDEIMVGLSQPLPQTGRKTEIRDPFENDKNEKVSYFDVRYLSR